MRRRLYDIGKRIDGQHNVWKWMADPSIEPLMSTPDADGNSTVVWHPQRYVIVAVRPTFKAALKWIKQQGK